MKKTLAKKRSDFQRRYDDLGAERFNLKLRFTAILH
jgi:hypothetical protein